MPIKLKELGILPEKKEIEAYHSQFRIGYNDAIDEFADIEIDINLENLTKIILRFNHGTTDENDFSLAKAIQQNLKSIIVKKEK